MKIESNKVKVQSTPIEVVSFLKDSRNLIHLLPQDKISDWKATENECSFKVQGGVIISLIQDGQKENEEIYMRSGQGTPFPFKLTIKLNDLGIETEGFILFDGEVNMFLKMMVEKPLTALFNLMSEKLKTHFEKEN
jgi:carbon monoxide dehydrogenase subunit G